MPTLKGQERKLVMTLPLASAPLSYPLLSPPAPSPHSEALPVGTTSPRSCPVAGISWLPSVTLQPRGSVHLVQRGGGAGSRSAGESHGSGMGSKWPSQMLPKESPGPGQGGAGVPEMLRALPSSLCYLVKCRDQVWSTGNSGGLRPGKPQSAPRKAFRLRMSDVRRNPVRNPQVFFFSSLELSMPPFPHLEMRNKEINEP